MRNSEFGVRNEELFDFGFATLQLCNSATLAVDCSLFTEHCSLNTGRTGVLMPAARRRRASSFWAFISCWEGLFVASIREHRARSDNGLDGPRKYAYEYSEIEVAITRKRSIAIAIGKTSLSQSLSLSQTPKQVTE